MRVDSHESFRQLSSTIYHRLEQNENEGRRESVKNYCKREKTLIDSREKFEHIQSR